MYSIFQIKRRGSGAGIWKVLFWWTYAFWVFRLWGTLFYRYRRHGMQHVPRTGPFLIAANHQSNFDPIFVGTVAYERVFTSIARESLFKSKILGWFMRSFGVIAIRRGESDTKAIRAALQAMQSGQGVLIFPEGTRSEDGKIGVFQRGFWLLLKKSKAPVLPLGIDGAFDAYPIGSSPKLFGCI